MSFVFNIAKQLFLAPSGTLGVAGTPSTSANNIHWQHDVIHAVMVTAAPSPTTTSYAVGANFAVGPTSGGGTSDGILVPGRTVSTDGKAQTGNSMVFPQVVNSNTIIGLVFYKKTTGTAVGVPICYIDGITPIAANTNAVDITLNLNDAATNGLFRFT